MHSQMPAAFGVQLCPVGQAPPHEGAGLELHGVATSTQPQCPVTALVLQSMLVGQIPPHWGAGL